MSRGRVLVIDDDEWVCRLLAVAMKESGFEITITENAAEGFYKAVEEQPDCIVCDVDLPDHNGYWVAKKIRAHPSRIANAPFVFLSGLDDREHRLEGFQVGGDAYLTKPFRIDEVVAQVDALIQMAARLNKARVSRTSIPPPEVAMHGDLAQMSLGTLLTLIDLERRSGILMLKSEGKVAEFNIVAGSIAGTTLDGVTAPPLEATRKAMSWISGKFAFTPTEDRLAGAAEARRARMSLSAEEHGTSINALLMEAARLEDEERNAEGKPSSSSRSTAWKETLARHTPRPFAAVTGALPDSSSNVFTSRPPPSSGRGPPPPLDSIMAPPSVSESEIETYEPPGVVARPTTDASALAPGSAPPQPAAQSPSPQGIPAAVPLPRFPVRPAAGVPASAPSAPPPAPTFGPAPVGPAASSAPPPPAPTFGPTPVGTASTPPPAAPTHGPAPLPAAVPSRISPTPAVPSAPSAAGPSPPSAPIAPASTPGAIPAPPLASRFQGGRTPTLQGNVPRGSFATPPAAPTPRPAPVAPGPPPATKPAAGTPSTPQPSPPAQAPNTKPPVPKTAFGAKLRSMSPARPMRAVTPPSPPAATPATSPADVDSGWSNPPSAPPPPSSSDEAEPLNLDDLFEAEIPPSKGKNS